MLPLIFLSAFLSFEPSDERPACNAEQTGLMWPLAANTNPSLVRQLAREGTLWICSRGSWRYRWEQPSIHISQLKRIRDLRESKEKKAARPAGSLSLSSEP